MNGEFIRQKIKDAGFQLVDVAKKLNISPQNLESKLKTNDVKVNFLIEISNSINKSIYYFLKDLDQNQLPLDHLSETDIQGATHKISSSCRACIEKERVIESLKQTITAKERIIEMQDARIKELENKQKPSS